MSAHRCTPPRLPRVPLAMLSMLLACLIVLAGAGAQAHAAVPGSDPTPGDDATSNELEHGPATQAPDPDRTHPVVFIGVDGLAWSDISADTPALQTLTSEAVGSLVVRSVDSSTCPADGWLALNTGTRAADKATPCRELSGPTSGQVPAWEAYSNAVAGQNYDAQLGLLHSVLEAGEVSSTAIGPGAAIALADASGEVQDYRPLVGTDKLAAPVSQALASSNLVMIDAGTITDPEVVTDRAEDAAEDSGKDFDDDSVNPPSRTEQVQQVEAHAAAILAGIRDSGADPVVMLAGVSDSGESGLRVAAMSGPGISEGLLTSGSTHQAGYVKSSDLFTTLVDQFALRDAIPDGATSGAVMSVAGGYGDAAERRAFLADQDVHAQAVQPLVPVFFSLLVLVNLALFAIVALVLKQSIATRIGALIARRFHRRPAALWLRRLLARPVKALRTLRAVALGIGALPVSSFLANLIPWWRFTPPAVALTVLILAIDAILVAASLKRPWGRRTFGPAAFIAGVTALVLGVDVLTGATLQLSAVMGISTLVGARFYGMNNTTFALFTIAMLMVTIVATNPLVLAGRRRLAALVVAGIGVVVAAIDGAPSLGADFGGPPAILAGFAVMALLALGVRLTWRRVLVVLVLAGTVSFLVAFLDWLGPAANRTHLGQFFQTVLDGGLWEVVWRKLDQNISILFGNRPLTILAICGVLTVVYVLARPIRSALRDPSGGEFAWLSSGTPIASMGRDTPMLRPGLVGMAIALGIGLGINDSGIAIPALGVSLGVPLLIAATTTWMLSLRQEHARQVETG